jgi:hypothetical protein
VAVDLSEHLHILVKDPLRLGWQRLVPDCRYFKAAGEFDAIVVLPREQDGVAPS